MNYNRKRGHNTAHWRKKGFASGFESRFADDLKEKGVAYEYETDKIKYTKEHRYTPDFKIVSDKGNVFYVETKGYFEGKDRTKHLAIQKQRPDLDIRFVFLNAFNKLSKKSQTTYAQWCDKHDFKWAEKTIPDEWIKGEE